MREILPSRDIQFSFPFSFCDLKFCSRPECKPQKRFLHSFLCMMSILGYCIPRKIKMQKVCVFPIFTHKTPPKRCVNSHFQAKHAKYSNFCIIKMTEAIPTKFCTDRQVLVVCRPKISPTNPKWQTATILKKDKLLYLSNGLKFCTFTHIATLNPSYC